MRGFHSATLVVLKLRSSVALCLLVWPDYEQPRRGHLLATNGHAWFSSPALESSASLYSMRRNSPLKTPVTALKHAIQEECEDIETGRLVPIEDEEHKEEQTVSKWGLIKSYLKRGMAVIGSYQDSSKTEMEAVFDQRLPFVAQREELGKTEVTDESTPTATSGIDLPKGTRWAVAHPDTDLSGTWKPVVTSQFLDDYETYLAKCGTTFVFRQVCLRFCRSTRESIQQVDDGRTLHFHGKSPAGGWKRSLISSGADPSTEQYEPFQIEFLDPDKELVKVEAWWEGQGRIHRSVLREKPGVCGGEFETRRYLTRNDTDDRVMLVAESTFRPSPEDLNNPTSKFKPAFIRWQYVKE